MCVLAAIAWRAAASQVFPSSAYDHLTPFSTNDGEALSNKFESELVAKGSIPDPGRWVSAARQVLFRNPLEADVVRVAAMSMLATDRQVDQARSRMRLAERVSARDLETQLWLLEDAASHDDVAGTLSHYDRALSVFPRTSDLLFPILTAALDDPQIRAELVPYIRHNRPWAYMFVGTAVDQAKNTEDVADLLARTGGSRSVPGNRPLETMMLKKLVSNGQIVVAKHYADGMAVTPEMREGLRAFGFSQATSAADLRPFTWSFVEDLSIQTQFERAEGLRVATSSGISGVAADRVMVLVPGKWRFTQKIELPSFSPIANATWLVTCLTREGPREIFKQRLPQESGRRNISVTFDVDQSCLATRFRLTVFGQDDQEDSTLTIRSVELHKL